jgi:CheY-like chemotaxis protein
MAAQYKILIVEDDLDTRELLSTVLTQAGYQVATAEHALGAVCAVVRSTPDLVVADIRMPIVDGMGLASELKAHQDTRHIPVVAVTGYDSPENRASALKAGYDGYIPKPIDISRFPGQIAEFLRHSLPAMGAASSQPQPRPNA